MTKMLPVFQLGTLRNGMNYDRGSAVTGCKIIGVADFGSRVFPDYKTLQEINSSIVSDDDLLHEGDILFIRSNGNKNLVGRSMFIKDISEPICYSGFCIMLRPNPDMVCPQYLFYALRSPFCRKQYSYSQQTNITNLSQTVLGSVIVPIPDYEEQVKLSRILYSIDQKIQNSNLVCGELEATAKTLYDYWFVQFDFPDENGKPYRTSGGEMVWNKQLKREIPKGWTAKSLNDICNFRNGINYEKGCLRDCVYRIANVRNITASSFLMDVNDFDEITLPKEQGNRYVLNKSDIIIARSGTPGATRLVINPPNNVIFCGFIICCTPFNPNHRLYLTHFLKQLEGTNATKTGGSILQNVSQDTLKSLQVPLPDASVLNCFNEKIEPLVQMMQNIIDENRELMKLRDWLLPMLMNGQARVE